MYWITLFFAIALSIDGFGVGISYGMRKIKIPLKSLVVICLASSGAIFVSMMAGKLLASLIDSHTAEILGACSLVLVGIWIMIHSWLQNNSLSKASGKEEEDSTILNISFSSLGIVIKILKEPAKADLDQSGVISTNEAFFLGFALAMDAFGAGIGAAMAGFSPIFTPMLVALAKLVLVNSGLFIGENYVSDKLSQDLALLPGGVIFVLGLVKLIKF